MSDPVLYSFRRCPYAMRARMALNAAEIGVEHREVLLRDKPAAMIEASPKGTVPVLILPDGQVIDESLDIMMWALSQNDPENWLIDGASDRAAAELFLSQFKDRLDRYKYASRYDPTVARGAVDLEKRREAFAILEDLSESLSATDYLRGSHPRLLDIATFPFVRQFAAVEPDWWSETASSGLKNWLESWLENARFKRIMTKFPVWQPGPD